jgi:hypothetical protein
MPRKIDRIEFVVSAGSGAKAICIDDFKLEPIEQSEVAKSEVKASSAKVEGAEHFAGGNWVTNWASSGNSAREWLAINFHRQREIGGIVIDWNQGNLLRNITSRFRMMAGMDGGYSVTNGNGGRDYIYLPETDARFLRLNLKKASTTAVMASTKSISKTRSFPPRRMRFHGDGGGAARSFSQIFFARANVLDRRRR